MMWNGSWGFGGMLAMSLLMIAFWALVVAGVVWLVRTSRRPEPSARSYPVAMRILDERFARGDLTEEEFRQHRAALFNRG